MSFKDVAARGDHRVLAEVDNNRALIVGDWQGIWGQQLRPHPIHSLYTIT